MASHDLGVGISHSAVFLSKTTTWETALATTIDPCYLTRRNLSHSIFIEVRDYGSNRLALGSVSLLLVLALTNISHGQNLPPTMFATPKSFVELPKMRLHPLPHNRLVMVLLLCHRLPRGKPMVRAMEFGINGANGNSDNFNLRYGLGVRRKTDDNIFNFDTVYNYASQDDVVTQNRLFSIGREEWYFRGTPWGIFVDGTFEYDEFRAFDFRIASHVGLTYKFIDNVQTMLKGRAGAGVSREFGGPNDDWIPELIFGLDFEHKFSDNTKVFTTADYIPNINNF